MALTQQQEPAPKRRGFVTFLGNVWSKIAQPHASVTDVGARRQAQLMMGLALAISFTNILGLVGSVAALGMSLGSLVLVGLIVVCLIAFVLGRTSYYRIGALLLPFGFALSAYGFILAGSTDPSGSLYASIPVAMIMGSALLPLAGLAVLVLGNTLIIALLPWVVPGMTMATAGRDSGLTLTMGVLLMVITAFRNALERTRLAELQAANLALEASRVTLEERVVERTADLERRARYLEATATVARDAASVLDLRELLSRVALLLSEQLGFYHVAIFLLDAAGEWVVLHAASSAGGQRMLARGHRLQIGEGVVGFVAQQSVPRVALDVGADAVFFDNLDLPQTRSELALPLRAREQVIGVLDVQRRVPGAFGDEDVAVLQTLADQVAVAISNVRLFQDAQDALEAERQAHGEISRQAWQQLSYARAGLGYFADEQGVAPLTGGLSAEMAQADQSEGAAQHEGITVTVPVKVREQTVGAVRLSKSAEAGDWTPEEVALMETLTEQLGVALESARLYQDTQRRAARERLVGQVTARMRETLDLETILQTATREIRSALGAVETEVWIGTDSTADDRGSENEHSTERA